MIKHNIVRRQDTAIYEDGDQKSRSCQRPSGGVSTSKTGSEVLVKAYRVTGGAEKNMSMAEAMMIPGPVSGGRAKENRTESC